MHALQVVNVITVWKCEHLATLNYAKLETKEGEGRGGKARLQAIFSDHKTLYCHLTSLMKNKTKS